jgi:tetratricopeptide (TPR) repeat protein
MAMLLTAANAAAGQQNPQDILARAIQLHQANDIPGAIRLYREYLKSGPESLDAYTNYGAALAGTGEYTEAIEVYQRALKLKPDHPPALLNLALAYYKTGRAADAKKRFEAVWPLMPGNPQIPLLLADCNLRLGNNRRAIELLAPLEQQRPDDLGLAYILGTALLRDKQVEAGSRIIDKILRKGNSAEAHLLLGTAKYAGNDFAGARDEFRLAEASNPKLPEVHAYLGLALLNVGEANDAANAFRKELEINPESFTPLLQLGVLAKREQNYEQARRLLGRALRARPGDIGVRYQIAVVDLASGKTEAALQNLEAIVAESPNFRQAHASLATAYYRLKRKGEGDRERAVIRKLMEAEQAAKSQPGER